MNALPKGVSYPVRFHNAAGNKFIRIAFAMLKNQATFYVPGFEESTSDIRRKFSCKENLDLARQALNLLTNVTVKYQLVS